MIDPGLAFVLVLTFSGIGGSGSGGVETVTYPSLEACQIAGEWVTFEYARELKGYVCVPTTYAVMVPNEHDPLGE
jgi:hypothetical protein